MTNEEYMRESIRRGLPVPANAITDSLNMGTPGEKRAAYDAFHTVGALVTREEDLERLGFAVQHASYELA